MTGPDKPAIQLPVADELLRGGYDAATLSAVLTYRSGENTYELRVPLAEAFKIEEIFIGIRRGMGQHLKR